MMRLKANKRNVIYSMNLCANVSITPWKITGWRILSLLLCLSVLSILVPCLYPGQNLVGTLDTLGRAKVDG